MWIVLCFADIYGSDDGSSTAMLMDQSIVHAVAAVALIVLKGRRKTRSCGESDHDLHSQA